MADECPIFEMDPLDKRVINMDFGTWLAASSAQILSVAWVVPSGLTASDSSETSSVATNYFVSDNTTKEDEYELAVTITTDEAVARKKTQRFKLRVEIDC